VSEVAPKPKYIPLRRFATLAVRPRNGTLESVNLRSHRMVPQQEKRYAINPCYRRNGTRGQCDNVDCGVRAKKEC